MQRAPLRPPCHPERSERKRAESRDPPRAEWREGLQSGRRPGIRPRTPPSRLDRRRQPAGQTDAPATVRRPNRPPAVAARRVCPPVVADGRVCAPQPSRLTSRRQAAGQIGTNVPVPLVRSRSDDTGLRPPPGSARIRLRVRLSFPHIHAPSALDVLSLPGGWRRPVRRSGIPPYAYGAGGGDWGAGMPTRAGPARTQPGETPEGESLTDTPNTHSSQHGTAG